LFKGFGALQSELIGRFEFGGWRIDFEIMPGGLIRQRQ